MMVCEQFGEHTFFCAKDLHATINAYEEEIRKEVDGWERNKILSASESDLVDYLVEKYSLDPPVLDLDGKYIESDGETRIDVSGRYEYGAFGQSRPYCVPGAYVTVAIPFTGDRDLFEFRASTFSSAPPRGRIVDSKVLITFRDVQLDPEHVRGEIDRVAGSIEAGLGWIREDCAKWNAGVRSVAEERVQARKRRLLDQSKMVSALGLPLRRRSDVAASVAIPVKRRKRPVVLPPTPSEAFEPEPAIADEEYDYILEIVGRLALQIERSPATFVKMKEEQIRDLILVNLNGHYEGDATGETFNAAGKTDILVRASGRNVFMAECKIWRGSKAMMSALDQILGYLTWRDTKAALLFFCRNANFTDVLAAMFDAATKHGNCKREVRRVSDTHVRYLFRQKNDANRDLHLAVLAFNIPEERMVCQS